MKNHQTGRRAQAGFTLVEIMVVIVILGLLATMVATNVIGASDEARSKTAQTSARTIHEAIKLYYSENGKLPESLEDLVSEEDDGRSYVESLEPDPWGNDFILRGDTGRNFEVISCGPNGTEGDEDDISSRKKKE
ncbi:MAG: type II secretion system protein GspG [bacterium]|nr:type II secretion system protein GspG [bacterium]